MRFWHWYLLIKQPTASVHPGSRKVTPNRSTSDRWARTERVVFVGAYSQRAIWFPTHYITVLLFWLIMHNNIKGQARREWVQKPQVLSSVENNNDISLLGWILMFVAWRGVVSVNIYWTYVLVQSCFRTSLGSQTLLLQHNKFGEHALCSSTSLLQVLTARIYYFGWIFMLSFHQKLFKMSWDVALIQESHIKKTATPTSKHT